MSMVDALPVLKQSVWQSLGVAPERRVRTAEVPDGASPRPAQTWMITLLLTSLLTLGGCDRKPTKAPSSPEPPRPKMSPDGYRQSLLGNAILSNALLSYKVQCNEQRASIRICRIPAQVHTNREALGT